MNNITQLIELLKFGPEYGDWSGAIVSIVFGLISFVVSAISAIILYFRWLKESQANRKEQERLRKAEEEQTYITLRIRYDEIWSKLTENGLSHLYVDYRNNKSLDQLFKNNKNEVDKIRTVVWQLINHLSDVEFFYCKKMDTLYWKRWEAIFKYVFSKPLIQKAFIKNKEQFIHNKSFTNMVDNIILEKDLKK